MMAPILKHQHQLLQKLSDIRVRIGVMKSLGQHNLKVGLSNGEFDLFSPGHLHHIKEAKKHCSFLIVLITADDFINPNKPYYPEELRYMMIDSLKDVDYCFINRDESISNPIEALRPDFYFKGYNTDLKENKIQKEKTIVEKYGGKLVLTSDRILVSIENPSVTISINSN